MRRMINNTTAIAACLSLLLPPMAQAQGAPAEGEQPPPPPVQEQQAEPAAPEAEAEAAPAEPAAPEPAAETAAETPAEATAEPEAPAPESPAAEPEAEAAAEPEAPAPEPAADATPAPQEAEAQAEPAESPAQAEAPADAEGKSQRAEERAERQAEQEQSTADAQAERPAEAPRQQDEQPPATAGDARQQDQERPAPAAREQQADRPEPAPTEPAPTEPVPTEAGESADPLSDADASQAEQSAPKGEAAEAEPGQAQTDTPATPDQNDLGDALAREQAVPEAAAEGQPPAADPSAPPSESAPEADAPATEGAQQAAEETGAATAAALDDDQQGEVAEQQITKENSRSSSEDFATSLRDALAPQQAQTAERGDDDDDNDLAKALLLGLGAVAVGSYLNNNRQVALSAPDRVVVTRADGSQEVIKDEVALLRQPGSTVATENFDDGSSRTVVSRADGSRVVTIRDADLRVLRRTLVSADGTQTRLIDDTAGVEPVDVSTLPAPAPATATGVSQDEAALRAALRREVDIDRRFSLGQIRSIPQVRALVPPVTIDAITFDTGSAAISPDQVRQLSALGNVIQDAIAKNPQEVFLIEGHTDTVGPDAANLALSDRRAESVALALSEYFQVAPENLVVQGYGEQFLQIRREGDVRENRRAAVRRITDLLQTAQGQ
ncbi:OmpA family protein [Paracoccus sp. S3-43]|uniref:OmpA family protein n=1 Tax=Paracoccus sp. S3-43 TaxID=3030011 RepID=UPI0023AF157C|nr:OmpA family protein [Paracoccus sp. S3-43]WEF24122.1 OmpA family protein [Paracoccus sp. S3-43]